MKITAHNLAPRTKKIWLHLTAGLMWSAVGILLLAFAATWLFAVDTWIVWLFSLAGCLLALAIFFFGFSKLAAKNINRIVSIPQENVCLFAFQRWTSYLLILVMIGMGIFLRHYSTIPKPYLAILYIGIGASLIASSFLYYVQVVRSVHSYPAAMK
jgi:hypothetical protein